MEQIDVEEAQCWMPSDREMILQNIRSVRERVGVDQVAAGGSRRTGANVMPHCRLGQPSLTFCAFNQHVVADPDLPALVGRKHHGSTSAFNDALKLQLMLKPLSYKASSALGDRNEGKSSRQIQWWRAHAMS